MAKVSKKRQQRQDRDRRAWKRQGNVIELPVVPEEKENEAPYYTRFEPRKEAQYHYMHLIEQKSVTFGTGSAGTGKTTVPVAMAAIALREKRIRQVIITRPILESKGGGNGIGFLKGTEEEKVAPYLSPVKEIMKMYLRPGELDYYFNHKHILFLPFEFMRGHTFNDAWVIADECQNATKEQMKLLLTRLGHNAKIIVNGDTEQIDLNGRYESGLHDAVVRFNGLADVGHYSFTEKDIVRHDLVAAFIRGYQKD